MDALRTALIGLLRSSYEVAIEVITFIVCKIQLDARFESPLSPSEFNKILTEICINSPGNGREMAKMVVSSIVQTSVTSHRDGFMVINNDNQLLDRFLDSLYNDSSNKDDKELVVKVKNRITLKLKQENTLREDRQDDEDQQYSDDEFEPESPNRPNADTGNTVTIHNFVTRP